MRDNRRAAALLASTPGAIAVPVPRGGPPLAGADSLYLWHRVRVACISLAILLAIFASVIAAREWLERRTASTPPWVPAIAIDAIYIDNETLTVTVAAGGQFAPWTATRDDLLRSRTMWQRMHLADWNPVPPAIRDAALDRMLDAYVDVMWRPAVWDAMTADQWDRIPQPARVIAYRQMTAYWAGFYGVGRSYGLPPATVSDTLTAIVMSESLFDHRALAVSRSGNHDLGLVQASDFARARMRSLYEAGRVDAWLVDADYWNPWRATQFLAIWMSLLLDEAHGDLELAVRAYHRGIAAADDDRGTQYFQGVQRRLQRFIRNQDAPAAWTYLWARAREIEGAEWPWLQHGGE